jgi:hypothetical protein
MSRGRRLGRLGCQIVAAFDPGVETSHPVDYRLVHSTFVTMFWDSTLLQKTVGWLSNHGYQVATVDTDDWSEAADMHRDIARTLDFPDYYGHNLDALDDCLGDVACGAYGVRPNATGLVLVLQNYDRFAARSADTAHQLLDIFATQARHAAILGNRMFCLVQSGDPRLALEPVGATPVMWNDAEFLDANRGL